MNSATKSTRPVGIAAALILVLAGCATEPEHPMPSDYCDNGMLICVGANGNSEWERGEAFSCRCDYSGTLSGSLDGNPGWVKKALEAKHPIRTRHGPNSAIRAVRDQKAGRVQGSRNGD